MKAWKREGHIMNYKTSGVCCREIIIDINEETNTINKVNFQGGCSGNTSGIAMLVEGMSVDDVIHRLEGINCGSRPTSCPDQLAKALIEWRFKE